MAITHISIQRSITGPGRMDLLFCKVFSSRSENQSQPCNLVSRSLAASTGDERREWEEKKKGRARMFVLLQRTKPNRERERERRWRQTRLRQCDWWFTLNSAPHPLSGEPNAAAVYCAGCKHLHSFLLFTRRVTALYKTGVKKSAVLSEFLVTADGGSKSLSLIEKSFSDIFII